MCEEKLSVIPHVLDFTGGGQHLLFQHGQLGEGIAMQLATWNEQELVALAKVYVKHRQFDRSEQVRGELKARLHQAPHLTLVLGELDGLKSTPFTTKIFNLFSSRKTA